MKHDKTSPLFRTYIGSGMSKLTFSFTPLDNPDLARRNLTPLSASIAADVAASALGVISRPWCRLLGCALPSYLCNHQAEIRHTARVTSLAGMGKKIKRVYERTGRCFVSVHVSGAHMSELQLSRANTAGSSP